MSISVLGIDLGKSVFHLFGVDDDGRAVFRKKLSRSKFRALMANLPSCLVGLEACAGAHHIARVLESYGHDVRLMSPQFVKPYVKSNKNDYLDAEAICEAVQRPTMRFVPVKNIASQDMQTLHRARSRAVANRKAQVNQIRGFLLEYGLTVPKGVGALRKRLPEILEDAENGLTEAFRELLFELDEELRHLDERVCWYDARIDEVARNCGACRNLQTVPGIGPVVATALVAGIGNGTAFKNARQVAAWLGLVPRQHSTGGRQVLLGISKRGDVYLRTMLIHGARAVLRGAAKSSDRRLGWFADLQQRRGTNVAVIAMANKLARIAWAMLRDGTQYRAQTV
jgi:transposase